MKNKFKVNDIIKLINAEGKHEIKVGELFKVIRTANSGERIECVRLKSGVDYDLYEWRFVLYKKEIKEYGIVSFMRNAYV
jgi:hypothetical protein